MTFNRFLLLIAWAALLTSCSRQDEEGSGIASGSARERPSKVERSPQGRIVITLDTRTQRAVGLQVSPVRPIRLNPELSGFGRVLDVSSLVALVAEQTTARAASEASQAELKRLKTLAVQNNASERALQAAQAAAIRDRTQLESARLRLLSCWGKEISSQPDLIALVEKLASLDAVVVEIDIPAGGEPREIPTGGRILSLDPQTPPILPRLLGPAPVVSSLQGRGYLFLVESNAFGLAPGAALTGFLEMPGVARVGVAVPRDAIIEFNGATWVYRQMTDSTFQRTEVTLESPLPDGWFVSEKQLKPEVRIVTMGAQELLSEELRGQEME